MYYFSYYTMVAVNYEKMTRINVPSFSFQNGMVSVSHHFK